MLEMYIENTEGFEGEGDLFTRFGVEILDEATFVVSRRRWADTVARYDNEITVQRPAEGDVIYLPLSKSFFQISHVEHEQPFYQLQKNYIYTLKCQLYRYEDEVLDTGVETIDDEIEQLGYMQTLTLIGQAITATGTATSNRTNKLLVAIPVLPV